MWELGLYSTQSLLHAILLNCQTEYEHWPLGAWRMSWRCGLGTQVILFVVSHAVFLSSFRLDVQV
jgi:hypothetical protein